MSNWNPTEQPYRVLWSFRSNAYGLHGWASSVKTFATLEEAKAAANERAAKGSRLIDVVVQIAVNPETWQRNGRWKKVASRKVGETIA